MDIIGISNESLLRIMWMTNSKLNYNGKTD